MVRLPDNPRPRLYAAHLILASVDSTRHTTGTRSPAAPAILSTLRHIGNPQHARGLVRVHLGHSLPTHELMNDPPLK
jgi:hypothetical protein